MIIVEDGMQSIYVDGLFDSSYQFTQPQLSNNKNLNIGWNLRPGEEQFKGEIDDIRIYNRALTAEEIKAVYLE